MKKRVVTLVITALSLAGSSAFASGRGTTGAPILWKSIRVGMSAGEVQRALPGSSIQNGGKSVSGTNTLVAGAAFDAFVDVSTGRATKVELVGSGYATPDVRAALNAKYGQPVASFSCQPLGQLAMCSGAWSAPGGVRVSLLRLNSDQGSALTITYEAVDLGGI